MKTILKAAALLLALALLAAFLVATLRVGPLPSVEIRTEAKAIGARTGLEVVASAAGRGLAGLRVELEQAGTTHVVARRTHRPLPPWAWSGERTQADRLRVEVGRSAVPGLVEGEAVVRVVAERAGTWLRHPDPVVKELRLPVRLSPPALALLSSQHYVAQGGSGVVVYRAGATAVRDGVRAGASFFPGSPLPGGGKEDRLALFGVPWDLADAAAAAARGRGRRRQRGRARVRGPLLPEAAGPRHDRPRRGLPRQGGPGDPGRRRRGSRTAGACSRTTSRSIATCGRRTRRSSWPSGRARRAPSCGRSPSSPSATPRSCRPSPTSAPTSTRGARWTPRPTSASTSRWSRTRPCRPPTAASSSSRATSASTATPSSWTTASASAPSTRTSPRSR